MQIVREVADEHENQKYIFQIRQNCLIEAVKFCHNNMEHFCVPSQIGCAMGCLHCATSYTSSPYIGQISYFDMVSMVEYLLDQSNHSKDRVLSFSGHGEPMLNWNRIEKTAQHFEGHFSIFHLTSVGILETMSKILQGPFRPTIYFSIHGSCDQERDKIVALRRKGNVANIAQIISFCRKYSAVGGKCVWNYMVHKDNSSEESAQRLSAICQTLDFPLEIRFTKYVDIHTNNGILTVEQNEIAKFMQIVTKLTGRNIQLRLSELEGIASKMACGQLRASLMD